MKRTRTRGRIGLKLSAHSKTQRYDYEAAKEAGLKPDASGHMPSRVPSGRNKGLLLKLSGHPTLDKTLRAEARLGYTVKKGRKGRLFSMPSRQRTKKRTR